MQKEKVKTRREDSPQATERTRSPRKKSDYERVPWKAHPTYPREGNRRDRDEDRRPKYRDVRYKSEYERLRIAEDELRAAQENLREAQRGAKSGDESSRSDPFPREEEYVRGSMGDHHRSDVREPRYYDRDRKRESQRRNYEEETHHRRRRDYGYKVLWRLN